MPRAAESGFPYVRLWRSLARLEWPPWLQGLLWPAAQGYRAWMVLRALAYQRGWLPSRRLPAKVISVGNLTVGGTGKTPLLLHLAAGLAARGWRAAVLTRGYGRRTRTSFVIRGRSEESLRQPFPGPAAEYGDEPVLLARRLPELAIGIGADRFGVAHRMLEGPEPDRPQVFLLDDGFQHLRLARDLDLVVIDATDPFGGGTLLPAGRLREPLSALARAHLLVLTRMPRAQSGEARADSLLEALRRVHPRAPIFLARTRFQGLYDATTHRPAERAEMARFPALAFCGIGNPEAFAADLTGWGFPVAGRCVFPDHHRYRIDDFKTIIRQADRARARWLVTTEKDAINFTVIPPSRPPCYYVRIDVEIEGEADFWRALLGRLEDSR